ncbi:hypothetical protein LCGC14_0806130 [marine sediment metagenome]|uniref:Uncharacterized protein n=1 Tax=marine sediment metagenome TaxID=412755 RepID=A0A0F9SVG9_9ZZZZ
MAEKVIKKKRMRISFEINADCYGAEGVTEIIARFLRSQPFISKDVRWDEVD